MQLEQPDCRTEQLEELQAIFLLISYIMLSLNSTSIKSLFSQHSLLNLRGYLY